MFNAAKSRVAQTYNAVKDHATGMFVVAATAMAPGFALAQSTDFDPSTVTAKITTYVGYGIVMLAAFILGKWTLKALGVIGGK
jgi:hypothetical protein